MLTTSLLAKLRTRLLKPSRWSIGAKILVAILVAAILPMIIAVNYNLQQSLERIESNEFYELELLAATKANQLDRLIRYRQNDLSAIALDSQVKSFLAASPDERQQLQSQLQSVLENPLAANPSYDAIYLLDPKGRCIAATNPLFLGKNYSFRNYYQQATKGKSVAVDILFGTTSKQAGLYIAKPVRSAKNNLSGVAILKIDHKEVWSLVNEIEADSPTDTLLVDQYGIVVSHSNPKFQYQSLAPLTEEVQEKIVAQKRYDPAEPVEDLGLAKLANLMLEARQTGHTTYYSVPEKTDFTIGFSPLKTVPWIVGVTKPKAVFRTPVNNSIWQSVVSVLLVTGIAAFAALLVSWSIVKPIRTLILAARSLAAYKFDPDLLKKAARSRDDIGELARVFLALAQEIKRREQDLQDRVSQLQIEIDEGKKERQVAEVTNSDYFKQLQHKAKKIKQSDKQ